MVGGEMVLSASWLVAKLTGGEMIGNHAHENNQCADLDHQLHWLLMG